MQKTVVYFLFLLYILTPNIIFAQERAIIKGRVSDERGRSLEFVNVSIKNRAGGVSTDASGNYRLLVPAATELTLYFSYIGYKQVERPVILTANEVMQLDVTLFSTSTTLPSAEVRDERLQSTSITKLNPKAAQLLPGISGSVESLIATLPGVSVKDELSSQYTVRGGNYDENLVYVNGIEIYRPFLIRSGQQEGLSFLNSALVSDISFSAGAFSAEYGDKLSSVLDITYKTPTEFAGSASLSLLGGELHLEGTNKDKSLTYLLGTRYKTTRYVLNAMEMKGDYQPNFADVQSLISYRLKPKWDISLLAYYSRNSYELRPKERETTFGVFQEAYRLMVYFDGQEIDRYSTGMAGLTLTHRPEKSTELKWIVSAYNAVESETFDILGQYWIGRLETNQDSEEFGNVIQSQGVGGFLDHARNYFNTTVVNFDHKGTYAKDRAVTKWGIRYQLQHTHDRMKEWDLIDSAGYTLPRPADQIGYLKPDRPNLLMNNFSQADNTLSIHSANAYMQQSINFIDRYFTEYIFTAGLRLNYWGYANELMLSPRLSVAMKPEWEKRMQFRVAAGMYNQPPFYREMRLFDGSLFENPRSQRSYQLVLGSDLDFQAWNRPFVFTSELYVKYFDHLVPYEIDNVRIRYYADQKATGYAAGLDLKVNGEFVRGIESWASLSFMKTEEDIIGDSYTYYLNDEGERINFFTENKTIADSVTVFPGYIPRPSDQRIQFSVLFQDYIPYYPSYRVHLRLIFGSRLPFGPPNTERYQQTRRMPEYRRVDIGFSKQIISEDKIMHQPILKNIRNMWVSAEILNLLQIKNTISYIWVKDVNNLLRGVPNYLTPRQFNIKLVAEF